ncbi:hypothetical protein F5146DRAFT_995310 [Armillaria mellea]|nr:hypothetical protein F5146DRAFT_995310 [Armillaria mellea]
MTSTADGVTLGRTHMRHVEVGTITFMSSISEEMMVEPIYGVALSRGTRWAKLMFFRVGKSMKHKPRLMAIVQSAHNTNPCQERDLIWVQPFKLKAGLWCYESQIESCVWSEFKLWMHPGIGNDVEIDVEMMRTRLATGVGLFILVGNDSDGNDSGWGYITVLWAAVVHLSAAVALNLFRRSRFIAYAGRVLRTFYGYPLLTVRSLGAAAPMSSSRFDHTCFGPMELTIVGVVIGRGIIPTAPHPLGHQD